MKTLRTFKHFAPLGAFAIVLVLFSAGCSQKLAPVIPQKTFPTSITDWTQPGFANPANPFDSEGLIHNNCMNYVAARITSVLADDTLYPGTDTLVVDYCDSVLGCSLDSMSSQLNLVRFVATHADSLRSAPWPSVLGSGSLADIETIEGYLNSSDSLGAIIDSIKSIESSAASNLSGLGLMAVQITAAISRYSISYWHSADTSNWSADPHKATGIPYGRAITYYSRNTKEHDVPLWSLAKWFVDDEWYGVGIIVVIAVTAPETGGASVLLGTLLGGAAGSAAP